jgi:hypothetical protein
MGFMTLDFVMFVAVIQADGRFWMIQPIEKLYTEHYSVMSDQFE